MQFRKIGVCTLSIFAAFIAVFIADRQLSSMLSVSDRLFSFVWTYVGPIVDECLTPAKVSLLNLAQGNVVEIGPGHGSNFKYFVNDKISKVYAIEPNLLMHSQLSATAEEVGLKVEIVGSTWENSNLEYNSFDTIVSSLVLCSVNDLSRSLELIQGYLKPGGVFIFIEHVGQSNGTFWRTTQNLINPVWRYVGDNCHLNRDTGIALELMQGWKEINMKTDHLCGNPSLADPKIYGYAIKA